MKHSTRLFTLVSLAAVIPIAGLAGIQGSGFRSFALIGPVTETTAGSVSVGGLPYSDRGASIEVDGQAGKGRQLEIGDVVTAYGHNSNIERLILIHAVRATVESVDLVSGTFTAAGQTIHVNAQTALSPALALVGLSALLPGAKVEVSGWPDSTGDIIASRIDLLVLGAPTQVSGHLASLDSGRQRFKINQLTVDFSTAEVEGVLHEGSDVLAAGVSFDGTGALVAKTVQVVQPLQVMGGQTGRLEGIITAITSSSEFEIDGQPVRVPATAIQNLHGPIALDAKVRVSGVFDNTGVLVVDRLQTRNR